MHRYVRNDSFRNSPNDCQLSTPSLSKSPLPYLVVSHPSDISSLLRAIVHPESLSLILSGRAYKTGPRGLATVSSESLVKGLQMKIQPQNKNHPVCVLTCCQTQTQSQNLRKNITSAVLSDWIVYFIIFLGIAGVLPSAIGPTHTSLWKNSRCV